jgi:hypothetical protein
LDGVTSGGPESCPQEAPRARQLLRAAEWYVGIVMMIIERTRCWRRRRTTADLLTAEGAATAAAETAHRECYLGLGEAAAYLNVLGGLDPL